ncbi:MAG: hypothetical protein BA864_11310 [Desulfuromonadales bacterium C00003093]|nr:MAG: hypothetical protein BA864_11310 [Desulfuromonadales bacterium C00003093]
MVSALLVLVIALATAGTASAAGSLVRDLPGIPVSPGEEITVGLTQNGFMFDVVVVTEVLPDGFGYVDGSYTGSTTPDYDPSTNTLIVALGGSGELSVTYDVTAGSAEQIESAVFAGIYKGFPLDYGIVTGDSTLVLEEDTVLPTIISVELNETEVTTGDPILVTVNATDNVGVVGVTAEGESLDQDGDIWAGVIIAEEGTHTVHVCAMDAADNAAWDNSTSYIATTPDEVSPVIHSVELNETEATAGDMILVTANATDNVGVTGVNAEGVELTPQGGNIWDGCIMAGLGENIVHVCARDAADNAAWDNSTSYNGTWDRPNPSISITPDLKYVSAGGTAAINITVDPNTNAIQGAQTDLVFDPNFITVDGLSNVGEIFEGHTTFETVYLIDNVNGVVSNIGSAIIDGTNVTSAGVLATVTITVNGSATGDSTLELVNTEVTAALDGGIPVRPPDLVVNNGTLIMDTTSPVITNVANGTPTADSVTITWDTDEESDSLVKYGESSTYTDTEYDAEMVTSHSITLTALNPGTIYYFVVNSTDACGNSDESDEHSFMTAEVSGDTESPVINSVELNETEVTAGDPILVTVNATDDIGVVGVTAEDEELTQIADDIWAGTIITELGINFVNVSARDAAGNVTWDNSTSYNATMPEGPLVTNPEANPTSIAADGVQESRLNVTVVAESDIDSVVINLSEIGGPEAQVMECLGDDVYSAVVTAAVGTTPETYCLPVNASDVDGNYNDGVCIELTIEAAYAKGDLDHNGQVADAVDVAMMLQASVGDITATSEYDLDGNDQNADAVDVAMMLQASVGDITL